MVKILLGAALIFLITNPAFAATTVVVLTIGVAFFYISKFIFTYWSDFDVDYTLFGRDSNRK